MPVGKVVMHTGTFVRITMLALVASAALWSQTTYATLTGTVKDTSGAVVPKARITVTNVETNIKSSAESNEVGDYTIPQLKEGTYTLVASATGFQDFNADQIILAARDIRRLEVVLPVGGVISKIEVTEGATLIQTESSRLGDLKTSDTLKTVPLNARWMWAFMNLTPNFNSGPEGYRFGGSRANQANWAIDGTTFNDGNGSALGPQGNYIESFGEMRIDLANNSAEYGAIGQVTVVTKSGNNQLHGSAFDYYQTPMFKARNPFATARPTGVSHLHGGSISGPVYIPKLYNGRNRTFFFASFENSIGGDVTQSLNPTVPLAAWHSGDFSALPGGQLIYDPQNGQPFPGNKIPASRINAVSQKIQDAFYPLPNFGNTSVLQSQNFRQNLTRGWAISKYFVTRVDHHFNDRNFIFGRFTFTRAPGQPWEDNLPTIGQRKQRRDTRSATFSYTHLIGSGMVNEARWGMDFNNNPIAGPLNGPQQVQNLGLVGLAPNLPDISGMLNINWSGIGLQPLTQIAYTNPGYRNHNEQWQDILSWYRGRHSFKFGVDVTRVEWDDYSATNNLFGNVTFSSTFTAAGHSGMGNPYADFLLGIPTTANRAFPPIRLDRNRWQNYFFAQDDFKISSRMTLNLGIRYELTPPWRENGGHIATYDLGTGAIVVPDSALSQVSALFPKNYVKIMSASAANLRGNTLVYTDKNNFAPRIGMAYRPWDQNTVFRAGYGIYYDFVPQNLTSSSSPFVLNEAPYTNPAANPDVIFPRVFPAAGTAGPSSVNLPAAMNPHLKIPYSMQWSFTVERQQWNTGFRASYMGTNTRQGLWDYNYNSPLPGTTSYISKARAYPQYPDIMYWTNGAGHNYNALTLEVQRRMSKGVYFQSGFTWAKDMYNLDDQTSAVSENPFNRNREYAPSQAIPKYRWVSNMVYQLPFGEGKHFFSNAGRLANLVIGGWEYAVVYSAQSGQNLTPLWTGPDPTGTAYSSSSTPANVTIRPNAISNPNLPGDQRSVNRWFNAAALTAPTAGQFGTSAKGVIRGPGFNSFNMEINKSFKIREKMRLRYEAEGINVFNHPNWSNPAMNISQVANVGVISGVGWFDSTGPRVFQMSLRLEW